MSTPAFLTYGLHWMAVIVFLAFSWRRSRTILHPHLMFTTMLCVLMSDFLIRGYNDENWIYIRTQDLYSYQLTILTIFVVTVLATALVREPRLETLLLTAKKGNKVTGRERRIILVVGLGLLSFELYKRFGTVGWSIDEVIRQSLLPRGQSEWDQAIYAGNYVYALLRILFPFSGIAFAYLLFNTRGIITFVSLIGFGLVVTLLVLIGSRTPVVMCLAALWLFGIFKIRRFAVTALFTVTIATVVAATTSTMVSFRAYGYANHAVQFGAPSFAFTYHQDDSYYRTVFAYDYAAYSGQFWDGFDFIFAILVNPIPRAFWPEKPLLDVEFWGGYKLGYVTNLYLGEIVAIVGVEWAVVVSFLVGLALYYVLYRAIGLLKHPMGFAAYLLVALYVYMCLRSALNVMQFIYLPAFAVIAVLSLARLQARRNIVRQTRSQLL